MKVKSAIKRICGFCQIIRRGKTLYVRCQKNNRHKQRQGFHTLEARFKLGDKHFCECEDVIVEGESEGSHNCTQSKPKSKDGLDFIDQYTNKMI